jgi:transcriptional regulator with XRE-family HTH domain
MQKQVRGEIGGRLRAARVAAGLTQQDVATDFLRSRQAISSWESGRTLPTVLELRELAVLYGTSTDKILLGSEDMEQQCKQLLERARSDASRSAPLNVAQ